MSGLETWVCNDIIYSNLDLGQKESMCVRACVYMCVHVHVCCVQIRAARGMLRLLDPQIWSLVESSELQM